MGSEKRIVILGGDLRQVALAQKLADEEFSVSLYGLPGLPGIVAPDWRAAVRNAHAVLLPLPASFDGIRVAFPLATETPPILFEDLFDVLPIGVFLSGGKCSPSLKAAAESRGFSIFDYYDSDTFKTANALPTAEGTVEILMREISRTISGLPVLITGYGKVARALSSLLVAMHAKVTIAARKSADLENAMLSGCAVLPLTRCRALEDACTGYVAIVNTVPAWLFTEDILSRLDSETLLIDLSSAPGGVDPKAALRYGRRIIYAPSLPGKYAPVTAGEIIATTILYEMKKEGVL